MAYVLLKVSVRGPYPDLVMKIGRNPEPTRVGESVAFSFWQYFRRKAGGPARLRSASVVQSCFILDGFSFVFRRRSEFRRRLKNKTVQN